MNVPLYNPYAGNAAAASGLAGGTFDASMAADAGFRKSGDVIAIVFLVIYIVGFVIMGAIAGVQLYRDVPESEQVYKHPVFIAFVLYFFFAIWISAVGVSVTKNGNNVKPDASLKTDADRIAKLLLDMKEANFQSGGWIGFSPIFALVLCVVLVLILGLMFSRLR